MARFRRGRARFLPLFFPVLVSAALGVGCDGGSSPPPAGGAAKVVAALTAGVGAPAPAGSTDQTLASVYDAKAALYRQIAAAERAKAAVSAQVVSAVAAAAVAEVSKTVPADSQAVPAAVESAASDGVSATAVSVSRLVSAKDALGSQREKAAVLADGLAAQAQATADFHRALATGAVSR